MPIHNTNDGTMRAPYMRSDLNMGTLADQPENSTGPKGDAATVHAAIKAAGYQGLQGGDRDLCRKLGLGWTSGGRINLPSEADAFTKSAKDQGAECATLHVGWGMESDLEIDRLVSAILNASEKHGVPLYIETHRATITQDQWRTVKLVERNPEVRFNADYSHWYTGQEMVYGDFKAKCDFLEPVFERVRFFHGRIGNPSHIQVDVKDGARGGEGLAFVDHFREMWTRSCMGFLRSAKPGDYICFNPELLQPAIYYARLFPDGKGGFVEETDRWQQALVLTRVAQESFADAKQRLAKPIAARA